MSTPADEPAAHTLLHERVQRWIWKKGWKSLRDIQAQAVRPVLEERCDLVIAAGTASGKTEAAFLPICSTLVGAAQGGVHALYIGPLKALINDQFGRLEDLTRELEIPVHRWHGDVTQSKKKALLADPSGILLITPESLEALLALNGTHVERIFAPLAFAVIDELHAFIGIERGRQLQSLLHRIEARVDRRVPRIGLSATLGDMQLAREFLRPGEPAGVRLLVAPGGGSDVRLQVRGYVSAARAEDAEEEGDDERLDVARDLFRVLRGTNNLIFANSRRDVELYAELLTRMSEQERVPNEFFPHHGSLSKEDRETLEGQLKDGRKPVNALCTTTMEMGIDIGSVTSVAQLGSPTSVASLRQRLGRSGRRGNPATLRIYLRELEVGDDTPFEQRLHPELLQAVAVVRLLLAGWCEPPLAGALHLSTLVQQVLSLVAEKSGVRAPEAWSLLCERGPFREVSRPLFARFLKSLGAADLLTQMQEGTLVLGLEGERVVGHYSFYAAFQSVEEYRLVCDGRALGSLPLERPLAPGMFLVFGGRSWQVRDVDPRERVVLLAPGAGGRPPEFSGGGPPVHDRVRAEMHAVLCDADEPAFLDRGARALLAEAREHGASLDLVDRRMLPDGADVVLFPWVGDRVLHTLAVQLVARGLAVEPSGVALRVARASLERVEEALGALRDAGPADAVELAQIVPDRGVGKHDRYLEDELLALEYAAASLDTEGAWRATERLLDG